MLSITPCGKNAVLYFLNKASTSYYSEGGEPAGQWWGKGAQTLKLSGEVTKESFSRLFFGFDPALPYGVKKLRQTAGADPVTYTKRDGTIAQREPCYAWDLCFSAPKSVSIVWAIAPENIRKQIEAFHRQAISGSLQYLQEHAAFCRRGKGGVIQEKTDLVIAQFLHGTSRAQDPQLHTHCILMNVGVRADGTTGAIESKPFYEHLKRAGALYRAHLACCLDIYLGFVTEPHEVEHVRSFELKAVPKPLIHEFSKRSQAIENYLEERGLNPDEKVSAALREYATLHTRPEKQGVSREELFSQVREEGERHGFTADHVLQIIREGYQPERGVRYEQCKAVMKALDRLTKQNSSFTEREFEQAVYEEAQFYAIGAKYAQRAVKEWIEEASYWKREVYQNYEPMYLGEIEGVKRFTTRGVIARELDFLAQLDRIQERVFSEVKTETLSKIICDCDAAGKPLKGEQVRALKVMTGTQEQIAVVSGIAGTGKTYALEAARRAWEAEGYRVVGAAVAARAAEELEEKSGIRSDTLEKTLHELRQSGFGVNQNLEKVVLSGRASERQVALYQYQVDRLRYALDEQTVFVLDEASMVSTDDMKELLNYIEGSGAKLILVGDERQLPAIEAGGAFEAISERFMKVELEDVRRQHDEWQRESVKHLAEGNIEAGLSGYEERGLIIVSPSREKAVDTLISDWKMSGLKAPEDNVMIAVTNADVSVLNRKAQLARKEARLVCETPVRVGGQTFYQGDRVVFTKNLRSHGIKNGIFGTLEGVYGAGDRLTVRTDDGRRLSFSQAEFSHIKLGYAVTTHKVQGSSIPKTYVLAGGSLQSREQIYVQLSRQKVEARIYLEGPDKEVGLRNLKNYGKVSRRKVFACTIQNNSSNVPYRNQSYSPVIPRPAHQFDEQPRFVM